MHLIRQSIQSVLHALRTLTLVYAWEKHLTQSLFYKKVLTLSCNLLNAILKGKNHL